MPRGIADGQHGEIDPRACDLAGDLAGKLVRRLDPSAGRSVMVALNHDATTTMRPPRLDFAAINAAALRDLPSILSRWLPDGKVIAGREYVARNPRRADRTSGSFAVNTRSGRWADFASGERGGDPVSLAAFLFGLSQIEAARKLALMTGVT